MKKILLSVIGFSIWSLLFFSPIPLFGEWDPEECFKGRDISSIDNPDYLCLKQKVTEYLKESWCTGEKVNLLMDLTLLAQPEYCVEIGAFTGSSLLPVATVLQYNKKGKIIGIDAWSNEVAVQYLNPMDPNRNWWAKIDMKNVRGKCFQMIQSWSLKHNCQIVQQASESAATRLENEIDFLHLDGDYSETGSLRDINLYFPKVKKGGYILLSNVFVTVNGKQPKQKAFCELYNTCEMICEIENENAILFRKR